jgi:hypothetical protein
LTCGRGRGRLRRVATAPATSTGVRFVGQGKLKGLTISWDIRVHGSDAVGTIRGGDGVVQDLLRVNGTEDIRGGAGLDPDVATRVTTSNGTEPGTMDFTEYDTKVSVNVPADYVTSAEYRDLVARFGDSPESHSRWPINQ